MRCFLYILIFFQSLPFKAQLHNQIQNAGFEKSFGEPNKTNQFFLVKDWVNLTKSSPDLFSGRRKTFGGQIPGPASGESNGWASFEGEHCAGIITYKRSGMVAGNGRNGFREYISTKLNKRLIAGQTYILQFRFAVNPLSTYYCHEFGIAFTDKIPMDKSYVGPLDHIEPQLLLDTIQGVEKAKWYLYKQTFVATGRERFVTFGNFKKNKDSHVELIGEKSDYFFNDFCYILVDSIYLGLKLNPNSLLFAVRNESNKVFFDTNKDELPGQDTLLQFNNYLKMVTQLMPGQTFEIIATTDTIGSQEDNHLLSKKRAVNMLNYLKEKGIDIRNIRITLLPEIGSGRRARSVKVQLRSS